MGCLRQLDLIEPAKLTSGSRLDRRRPFEHSGSIASLDEWFDPARLRRDDHTKGWQAAP